MKESFLKILKWFFIILGIIFFIQILLFLVLLFGFLTETKTNITKFNDFSPSKSSIKQIQSIINYAEEYKDKNGNIMCFLSLEDRNGNETTIPIFASCYQVVESKIASDTIVLMLMYNTEDSYHGGEQLMFGTKKWVEPSKYSSFIIPLRRIS